MEKSEAIVLLELMGWKLQFKSHTKRLYTFNSSYPHICINNIIHINVGRIVTANTCTFFDSYEELFILIEELLNG